MKKNSPLQLLILVFLVFCQNGMGQKSSGEVAFTAIPRLHHQFPRNDIFKGGINQISSTANLAPSSLLTGIVSYWTLDETSGNAIDVAGGGNNGTPSGVTQHIAGKINTAYGFNGTSSYIELGNKANLSLTTSGSISAWIYPTDVTHMGLIVSKGNPGSDLNGFNLGFLYNTLYWELANSTTRISGSYSIAGHIVNNTWYLVTLTWDGSHVNLYLNGLAVSAPVAQTVTPVSSVYPFRIGARGDYLGSSLFLGTIDEVGVWGRALTAAEVTSLYSSGTGNQYQFNGGAANIPPVSIAGPNQNLSAGITSTTLNGSGTDADGVVVSYAWTQTGGPAGPSITSPNLAVTTVTGLSNGNTYTFQLVVTDNLGATGTSTVNVMVNSPGGAPTVWTTTGNSGTVDGTNFIGTTDNVPLSFRVNNVAAGRIDPGLNNTFFGYQSGISTKSLANTANGYQALYSNTVGYTNNAYGVQALYSNNKGVGNTANGVYALYSNTMGNYNTAIGFDALEENIIGGFNTAIGFDALGSNQTTGSNLTAVGDNTAVNADGYTNSTALGNGATITGSNQVVLGNSCSIS